MTMAGVRTLRALPHRTELEVELDLVPIERLVQAALRSHHLQDLTIEDPPMDDIVEAIYARADGARRECAPAIGGDVAEFAP